MTPPAPPREADDLYSAPRDADGWLEGQPPLSLPDAFRAVTRRRDATLTPQERTARAQAMAILSHMGVLFGLPMFLIPLIKRDHALSVQHAKASAIAFVIFHGALIASVAWHSAFIILVLASYLPAWHGIHRAARARPVGWLGFGPVGERLLPRLDAAQAPAPSSRQLDRDPDAPQDAP